MKGIILAIITLSFVINCAGGRSKIRLSKIKKPASFSPLIYLKGRVHTKGTDLEEKGSFKVRQKNWGILYSLIKLTDSKTLIANINNRLASSNADGIINLRIIATPCGINHLTGILGVLPFMPGCTLVQIEGEMVKAKIPKPVIEEQNDSNEQETLQ